MLRLREPEERLALLNITIETLPSMHVRGFKRTATNIVDYYQAQGNDFPDQDLRSMVRVDDGSRGGGGERGNKGSRRGPHEIPCFGVALASFEWFNTIVLVS